MGLAAATPKPAEKVIGYWPRLSRFYHLSFEEIAGMPYAAIEVYIEKMDQLEASEQLAAIQAASFVHYEEDTQDEILRGLERRIDGDEPLQELPNPFTLGAIGIAVVMED